MNTIGRLIPSFESQVNLKKFRGVSTSDALYRMSGVRITGFLGSITAIYGFSIDIFEDIQKEIDDINTRLNTIKMTTKKLMDEQLQKELKEKEHKEKMEKLKKEAEKREKREREKKGKDDKDKDKGTHSTAMKKKTNASIAKYNKDILKDDETILNNNKDIAKEDETILNNSKDIVKEDEIILNSIDNILKDDEEILYSIKDVEDSNNSNERLMKIHNYTFKPSSEKLTGILNFTTYKEAQNDYSYEFAYEYQYSLFEDECLKTVLEQRVKKYNFSSSDSNSKTMLENENNNLVNDLSHFSDLEDFISIPISKNKY